MRECWFVYPIATVPAGEVVKFSFTVPAHMKICTGVFATCDADGAVASDAKNADLSMEFNNGAEFPVYIPVQSPDLSTLTTRYVTAFDLDVCLQATQPVTGVLFDRRTSLETNYKVYLRCLREE